MADLEKWVSVKILAEVPRPISPSRCIFADCESQRGERERDKRFILKAHVVRNAVPFLLLTDSVSLMAMFLAC